MHNPTPSAKKAKQVTLENWYPCNTSCCNGIPLGPGFALDNLVMQSFVCIPADENFITSFVVELIMTSDRSGDSTSHVNGEASTVLDTLVVVTVTYINGICY